MAVLFAAEGARLIVCADLTPSASPSADDEADMTTHDLICQQHGEGRAVFTETDVGIGSKVEACVAKAVELGGRLDIHRNGNVQRKHGKRIDQLKTDVVDTDE
ncbi:MAG: hypothetical protein Q9173_003903 [Seirophora scorigena]